MAATSAEIVAGAYFSERRGVGLPAMTAEQQALIGAMRSMTATENPLKVAAGEKPMPTAGMLAVLSANIGEYDPTTNSVVRPPGSRSETCYTNCETWVNNCGSILNGTPTEIQRIANLAGVQGAIESIINSNPILQAQYTVGGNEAAIRAGLLQDSYTKDKIAEKLKVALPVSSTEIGEIGKKTNERAALQANKPKLDAEVTRIEGEITRTQTALRAFEFDTTTNPPTAGSARAEMNRLQPEVSKYTGEVQRLTKSAENLEELIKSKETRKDEWLKQSPTTLEVFDATLAGGGKNVKVATDINAPGGLNSMRNQFDNDLTSLKAQYTTVRAELATAHEKLKQAEEPYSELEKQYKKLTESLKPDGPDSLYDRLGKARDAAKNNDDKIAQINQEILALNQSRTQKEAELEGKLTSIIPEAVAEAINARMNKFVEAMRGQETRNAERAKTQLERNVANAVRTIGVGVTGQMDWAVFRNHYNYFRNQGIEAFLNGIWNTPPNPIQPWYNDFIGDKALYEKTCNDVKTKLAALRMNEPRGGVRGTLFGGREPMRDEEMAQLMATFGPEYIDTILKQKGLSTSNAEKLRALGAHDRTVRENLWRNALTIGGIGLAILLITGGLGHMGMSASSMSTFGGGLQSFFR